MYALYCSSLLLTCIVISINCLSYSRVILQLAIIVHSRDLQPTARQANLCFENNILVYIIYFSISLFPYSLKKTLARFGFRLV